MYATVLVSILLILRTIAHVQNQYSVNVGTVLFIPDDAKKVYWSRPELELLRARKHFQKILPPQNTRIFNDDYVNNLMLLFKNVYSTIKRETKTAVEDETLTTACSDAIGGYLKQQVLPVAKMSFYSGSLSQNNILRLHQFYGEIKNFLGTDGKGWKEPDKRMPLTMSYPEHVVRPIKNACQHLSVYEKSSKSLDIPMPQINWGTRSPTMFVPLKNQSLVSLDAPNHANVLFKYYDTAINCLQLQDHSARKSRQFEERLQNWLMDDVLPHLTDENLYVALGDVLTLVNNSHGFLRSVLIIPENPKPTSQFFLFGMPIYCTSKKILFVYVLLFIEIVWGIPALIYLICARKKKSSVLSKFIAVNKKNSDPKNQQLVNIISDTTYDGSSKPEQMPSRTDTCSENNNVEELGNQREFNGSKSNVVNESKARANCSQVLSAEPAIELFQHKENFNRRSDTTTHGTYSVYSNLNQYTISSQSLPPVIINPRKSKSNVKHAELAIEEIPSMTRKTFYENTKMNVTDGSIASLSTITLKKPIKFPYRSYTNTNKRDNDENEQQKIHFSDVKKYNIYDENYSSHSKVDIPQRDDTEDVPKIVFSNERDLFDLAHQKYSDSVPSFGVPDNKKTAPQKFQTGDLEKDRMQPFLEIKFDKPRTEISVGIQGCFTSKTPSKIPKRSPPTGSTPTNVTMKKEKTSVPKQKSLIPKPKQGPLDDIVLRSSNSKESEDRNKLNITL